MRNRIRILLAACGLAISLAGGGALRAQDPGAPGAPGFAYGDLKEVMLQGRLLSQHDEFARKYGARVTPGTEKQWALATPEGRYYTFLDTAEYRKLLAAGAGASIEVKARLFPRSQILEVRSYRPLPADSIRRRFYCGVCDIHTEEFGPCACCGKEVEPVGTPGAR